MTEIDAAPPPGTTGFFHELRTGAWRQANVIFALIFKELKTKLEGETHGSIVWIVLDPLQHVIILSAFWYFLKRTEINGVHVAMFLAIAMVPFTLVRMCMSSVPAAIRTNRSFYNFQQVKPIDALLARFILNMSLATFGEALMFFLLAWFLGLYINFGNLLQIVSLFMLTMVMSFGIALTIGTYGTLYDIILKVLSFISRPFLFVSAVFYSAADLPTPARYVLSWNPLVHIIEYMRYYALGIKPFPEADLRVPAYFTVVILFMGLTGYYANRQKLIQVK